MKNDEKWDGELNHLSCYLHTCTHPPTPAPPTPTHSHTHVCLVCIWRCEHARYCVEVFMPIYKFPFIHSFIHQPPLPLPPPPPPPASTYGDRAMASVHKRTLQHAARAQRLVMVRYQTGPVTVEHYSLPILLQANVFLCV